MFERTIWDKLSQRIFEKFQNFQKPRGRFVPKIPQIKHVVTGYLQQTIFIETDIS